MREYAFTPAPKGTRKDNRPRLTAYKKSRRGCGNCKLRKVKCDERKPECGKCEVYGVSCDYLTSPGHITGHGINSRPSQLFSDQELIIDVINTASEKTTTKDRYYPVSKQELKLLHRFESWTLTCLGDPRDVHAYRSVYMSLALAHPFLRHIMLTLTLMHDRQSGRMGIDESRAIAYHFSTGAAMLNRRITEGSVGSSEKDAMWACAGLLGALSFSSIEAQTPEEAWPLSSANLDWLNMVEGKREIWRIANPMRDDSIFYKLRSNFMTWGMPPSASIALHELAAELAQLCNVNPGDQTGNPYETAILVLSQLLQVESNEFNVARYLAFFGCMNPQFKALLVSKDARALLLMAYWYAKMSPCRKWWSIRRTILEGRAICIYLRRFHATDRRLVRLLSFPENILRGQEL